MPPQPGMYAQAGAAPQPPQPLPLPGMSQPGMFNPQQPGMPGRPQLPGAASPEEAAKARFDALKKAGGATGVAAQPTGLFEGIAPGRTANVFAGNKDWFSGLFDNTNKTGLFDSFFTDNSRSDSWL